jgi:hypothetical protein
MQFAKKNIRSVLRLSTGALLLCVASTVFGAQNDPATAHGRFGLPLYFEANQGQFTGPAQFVARGQRYSVMLAPNEARLLLAKRTGSARESRVNRVAADSIETATIRSVRMRLLGANGDAAMHGTEPLSGKANYFLGNEPAGWRAGVPLFGKVHVQDIYRGIDLVYYCSQRQLEYDFRIGPKVGPEAIALRFEGVDNLQVDARGDLVLKVGADEIRQHCPVIYQTVNGARKTIAGGYQVRDDNTVGFWLGAYDRNLPLVIDPLLSFSTYIGSSGLDIGWDLAIDGSGNIYVTGETLSATLGATAGAFDESFNGGTRVGGDAFVAKYDNTGSNLLYLTYLGGSDNDGALALAVDAAGNACLTGYTDSPDFPVMFAFRDTINGTVSQGLKTYPVDAFAAKLDASGSSLLYSTYLGGNAVDEGVGVALDPDGSAYITGLTESTNFPVVNAPANSFGGSADAFVAKITFNSNATQLAYSRYLGGTNTDHGYGIAVDAMGGAYVTGLTRSTNFPVANAIVFDGVEFNRLNRLTNAVAISDAFVTKVSADGSALVYSSYLGGAGTDIGQRIAVDSANEAYVTGYTSSLDFPETVTNLSSALSATNTFSDAFVSKVGASGASLVYSTLLGGRANDQGMDVAVDSAGNAFVAGMTASSDFPAQAPGDLRTNNSGANDVFIAAINTDATALLYSGYLGGSLNDFPYGIKVDSAGNAYVVGETRSPNFPLVPANSTSYGGGTSDGFVAKVLTPSNPSLAIARSADGLVLSWSAFLPEFLLESNSQTGPGSWAPVAQVPVLQDGRRVVTLNATNSESRFRLHLNR